MKKTILALLIVSLLVCLFSISISAASTDEFGEIEYVEGMSDKSAFGTDGTKDATSRVVLFDGEEYHTYPSYYIFKNSTTLEFDFSEINQKVSTPKLENGYVKASLIRAEIPENVTKIGKTLNWSSTLVYLYLPDTVTSIPRDGLHGCSALTYLNIPPACTEIGPYGLNGCSNLVTLDMTRATSLKSTSSEKGLNGLSSVKELIFPEGFESFGGMSSAASLTYVYFPNTTKHIGSIQNAKFTEFIVPEGVTSLGNKTFDYCPSLQKVTISKNVASIVTGSNPTFFGTSLTNLKEIVYTGSESDPVVEQLKTAAPKATITYANHCDVYYGEHLTGEIEYEFTSFVESSYDTSVCTRCGKKAIVDEYAPIMTFTGYSAKINGNKVSVTYSVDRDMLKLYEEKTSKEVGTVKIGVTAAFVADGTAQYESITDDLAPVNDKTLVVEVNSEYKSFDFILSGFTAQHYERLLVMCAYVYDGSEIYYIDNGGCNTYATPFAFASEAK